MWWTKNKYHFLSAQERDGIMQLVKTQEARSTGEIRIFIESKNPLVSTLERASTVFFNLQMQKTEHHNAVLIYIAYQHREFALFADEGCIKTVPQSFWKNEATSLSRFFAKGERLKGLSACIESVGNMLAQHFASDGSRKNELPDDIVFGK